jgi:HEPN domain-containing protein
MKNNGDAAKAWLRKAESDLATAEVCIKANTGLDSACFHCQQAAEKSLKAWLIAQDQPFPLIHDLEELIALCATRESRFNELANDAAALNPFAITVRYDAEFWPSTEEAAEALARARRFHDFVQAHWPSR